MDELALQLIQEGYTFYGTNPNVDGEGEKIFSMMNDKLKNSPSTYDVKKRSENQQNQQGNV